jgi:lysophospholipase L1-like esterase
VPDWFDQEVSELQKRTMNKKTLENLIVFYGSSTFTLWSDMEDHFPAHNIANLGFGGSTLEDCDEYFEKLVVPLSPKLMFIYAGDNDLDNGRSPEAVLASLVSILAVKRQKLPTAPIVFVSIKVSRARLHFMHKIAYTNFIIEQFIANQSDIEFLNITRRMVSRGYVPFNACFSDDPLHMNRTGYRIWGKSLSECLDAMEPTAGQLKVREPTSIPRWARQDDADVPSG